LIQQQALIAKKNIEKERKIFFGLKKKKGNKVNVALLVVVVIDVDVDDCAHALHNAAQRTCRSNEKVRLNSYNGFLYSLLQTGNVAYTRLYD